tara:strand:- start:1850 stop:2338 length:489 start_codon:yes stop_codon:yes gene_type:complete
MIREIDLLDNEQLSYITRYFKYLEFEDGKKSNPEAKNKTCSTVYGGVGARDLNMYCGQIIENKLKSFASALSQIYFVKYDVGGQYEDHYDSNPCGGVRPDYSMTCFLSDDYEGGELVITTDDGEVEIKLPKGKAVIYPGNLLHRVNMVTSGRRDVFLAWLQK